MVAVSSSFPPPSFAGVDQWWSDVPTEPTPRAGVSTAPPSTGAKIARRFFDLCENPRTRPRVVSLLQRSADSAVGGRLLVAFISRMAFRPFVRNKRLDLAAARFELVAAQLGGIAVLRYISRMEPLASMPLDDLIALVAPAIDAVVSTS